VAMHIKHDDKSLIKGLHHVTALAKDANRTNRFITRSLGLRRVKQTVNFDSPDIYHLYYGNELGHPGTILTYFPFPTIKKRRSGTGEPGAVVFSVPAKALPFWKKRLNKRGIKKIAERKVLGEKRLAFKGPDGECFELVENAEDRRHPWCVDDIPADTAIRGLHAIRLRVDNDAALAELLHYMGFEQIDKKARWRRFRMAHGNGANIIDVETVASGALAMQGAGSVHHIAFAVENKEAQLVAREALLDTGYAVTEVIDRIYFSSFYLRAPGGMLFEIATNEPGFERDETIDNLGRTLILPRQHEHLRGFLQHHLEPLED